MTTQSKNLDVAKKAANRLTDTGAWSAVAFDTTGDHPIVGIAVFERMTDEQMMAEMSASGIPNAVVMVTIDGPFVNVVARDGSIASMAVAQHVRDVVLEAAGARPAVCFN